MWIRAKRETIEKCQELRVMSLISLRLRCAFQGLRCGFRVSGFGFRVSGFGFRVSGVEFGFWELGFEVRVMSLINLRSVGSDV